jgi:AbiV family abortive infection protein
VGQTVSSDTLLQGAWYALEQAGRLLHSSATLFEADDHSTATGIAMLGREEIGRSRILRRLADKVREGKYISQKEVENACEDHVEKQRAAVLSTAMRTSPGERLDDLSQTLIHESPSSASWQAAHKELQIATDAKTKRTQDDRHLLRMRCFYIDLPPSGERWERPSEIGWQVAKDEICYAVNDYAGERDRLRDEVIESDEPNMAAVRLTMNPYPNLLPPRWPDALANRQAAPSER